MRNVVFSARGREEILSFKPRFSLKTVKMSYKFLLIILYLNLIFGTCSKNNNSKKTSKFSCFVCIREFKYMKYKDSQIQMMNTTITPSGPGRTTLKGIIFIPEDQTKYTEVHVEIRRCPSVANKKDCEQFMNFKMNNVCNKLHEKNQAWSTFMEGFHPKLECAVKKGYYTLHVDSFETPEFVLRMVPDTVNYYWRYKICLFASKTKYTFCVNAAGVITYVKNF